MVKKNSDDESDGCEYSVGITPKAIKAIKKLPKSDQRSIVKALDSLTHDPRPKGIEKLRENPAFFRLRQGNYRIVYTVDDKEKVVAIALVRHRSEAYKNLSDLSVESILEVAANLRVNKPMIAPPTS